MLPAIKCFLDQYVTRFHFLNAMKTLFVVVAVSLVSLGPFMIDYRWLDVWIRLFPFRRGLLHSSWAANFWAFYAATDLSASFLSRYWNWKVMDRSFLAPTRGLIGDVSFAFLPEVKPIHTFIITISVLSVNVLPFGHAFILLLMGISFIDSVTSANFFTIENPIYRYLEFLRSYFLLFWMACT
jgi:hypothetical protein